MRIRAVTFDCWNTLLRDVEGSDARARRRAVLAKAAGTTPDAAQAHIDVAWRLHDTAWQDGVAFTGRDMAEHCLDALAVRDAAVRAHVVTAFEEATTRAAAVDGALHTLEALASRGIAMGLICDTGYSPGRRVRVLLDGNGLLRPLAHQSFSDEVGVPKPAAAIFHDVLGALGVAPEEAVHVGDLRRTDVAGGRAVGMRTVRVRGVFDDPAPLPDAERVIDGLPELVELLRQA